MNRTRTGREAAAAALLSRKAIPLEERLFLPIVLAAVAVFACVFLSALGLDAGLERRRNDALATAFVERWFFGGPGQSSRAVPERPLRAIEPYVLVPLNPEHDSTRASALGFTEADHAFLRTDAGTRYVLVRHKGIFGADRALAVPRDDLPTVTDPDTSGRARLGLVLASGLGLYLVVVRYLLRRMVFRKLSALARVIYARKIFSLTGGLPFDESGKPVDGLWHARTWIRERLFRVAPWMRAPRGRGKPAMAGLATSLPARIERVAEPPHVPLETFGNDELGQIALALEEGILRLGKHESQVLGAYDAVGFPVWVFTRDGLVVHANRAALPLSRRALGATIDAKGRARVPEGATLTALFVGALGFDGNLIAQCLAACELRRPKFVCSAGPGDPALVSVSALPLGGKALGVLMVVPTSEARPEALDTGAPIDTGADPDLTAA